MPLSLTCYTDSQLGLWWSKAGLNVSQVNEKEIAQEKTSLTLEFEKLSLNNFSYYTCHAGPDLNKTYTLDLEGKGLSFNFNFNYL